jgi:hypothetical protein
MSSIRLLVPAALVLAAVTGCGSTARLVHSTPDGGVVAIPSNSNYWPLRYRDEAEKLMAQRCPNGYEIVEEKEVVTGKTATTNENVDRRTPTTNSRGTTERTTTSTTHSVSDKTEYRITFRSRESKPTIVPTTAVMPTTTPQPPPLLPQPRSSLPSRPVPLGQ